MSESEAMESSTLEPPKSRVDEHAPASGEAHAGGTHPDHPEEPEKLAHPTRLLCIRCKYDLFGLLPEDRCPQCGEPVSSSVELAKQALHGSLGEALRAIIVIANGRPMTIGDIQKTLGPRGYPLINIIVSIPFFQPFNLPGFSAISGAAVAAIGFMFMIGKQPRLPKMVMNRQLEFATLEKIAQVASNILLRIERFIHIKSKVDLPPITLRITGAMLLVAAAALAVPWPPFVPATNFIPALGIVLMSVGLIERSQRAIQVGIVVSIVTWLYFAVIAVLFGSTIMAFFGLASEMTTTMPASMPATPGL